MRETHIESPQVGFLFSRQDFEGGGFPDTVSTHEPQHLTWTRDGQPDKHEHSD